MNRLHRSALHALTVVLMTTLSAQAWATLVVGNDTLQGTAYTTYTEPGDGTYRIICQTPCPIPLATLQAASDGFRAAKTQLLALSGLDTLASLQPVDMAYEENSLCPRLGAAAGYSEQYQPYGTGTGDPWRAKSCLFLWNAQQAGDIDWFTPSQAQLLSSQTLAIHEYAHSIFYRRHRYSYEDFVRYWSYAISGTVPLPDGLCSQNLVTYSAAMIYELCQRYGADDSDIRYAMHRLRDLYQYDQGYHGGTSSVAQLRDAFDYRLNADTSQMFLDLGYRPQQVGRTFNGEWQLDRFWYDDGLPDDSFHIVGHALQQGRLKLEQPSCLRNAPFLDFNLAFQLVPWGHREYNDILPNASLAQGLEVTYSYAHWTPQPGVNPLNLRLYFSPWHCGQPNPSEWTLMPDNWAQIDHVNKTVTFWPPTTGTFALIQPEAVFAGGFE